MNRRRIALAGKTAATAAIAVVVWLFVWPSVLGGSMTYTVVAGPSMEPQYYTGDFVAARAQDDYRVGDIVVFTTDNGKVIHRIIGGDGTSGYAMQGDNNPEIDRWTPTNEEVLGKAVLYVPDAGNWVLLLREVLITPPFPYLLAAFVFLVIVLGDDKKERRRPRDQHEGMEPAPSEPLPPEPARQPATR